MTFFFRAVLVKFSAVAGEEPDIAGRIAFAVRRGRGSTASLLAVVFCFCPEKLPYDVQYVYCTSVNLLR